MRTICSHIHEVICYPCLKILLDMESKDCDPEILMYKIDWTTAFAAKYSTWWMYTQYFLWHLHTLKQGNIPSRALVGNLIYQLWYIHVFSDINTALHESHGEDYAYNECYFNFIIPDTKPLSIMRHEVLAKSRDFEAASFMWGCFISTRQIDSSTAETPGGFERF